MAVRDGDVVVDAEARLQDDDQQHEQDDPTDHDHQRSAQAFAEPSKRLVQGTSHRAYQTGQTLGARHARHIPMVPLRTAAAKFDRAYSH